MVTRKPDESIDSLLKRFKKDVADAGIVADYRKHLEYIGPSMKKRLKSDAARKRAMKLQRKKDRYYNS